LVKLTAGMETVVWIFTPLTSSRQSRLMLAT